MLIIHRLEKEVTLWYYGFSAQITLLPNPKKDIKEENYRSSYLMNKYAKTLKR